MSNLLLPKIWEVPIGCKNVWYPPFRKVCMSSSPHTYAVARVKKLNTRPCHLLWMSRSAKPNLLSNRHGFIIFFALLLFEFLQEFIAIYIFRSRWELIHRLDMLWSESPDRGPSVIYDSSSGQVYVIQCPSDHVIVWEKPWSGCNQVHTRLNNYIVLSVQVVLYNIIVIVIWVWIVYQLGLQNVWNKRPGGYWAASPRWSIWDVVWTLRCNLDILFCFSPWSHGWRLLFHSSAIDLCIHAEMSSLRER